MLLCSATIGGTLYRFSDRQAKLAHPWHRRILSFSSPNVSLSKNYGGRLSVSEGKITFSPDFYTYPPPMSFDVELRRWTSGETGDLLFDGTVYLDSYNSKGAEYRLYAPAYTAEAASGTVLATTIVTSFTTGAAALGLTLDATGARSPAPAINYTTTVDALWVDLLSSIAEFFCHIWWIDKSTNTLYLQAIETKNGADMEVGREFFSPACKYPAPTAEVITSNGATKYRKASTVGIGKSENVQRYLATASNINAALQNILDTSNTMETEVTLPMANGIPAMNQKIIAIDRKVTPNLEMWCFAQNFDFDFRADTVKVSGKGGVTAL